jgi:DNA-binding protein H-NS
MEAIDLKSMPSEELWKLHEAVTAQLDNKLAAEKAKLAERETRLREMQLLCGIKRDPIRRPYPKVFPKYQNPRNLAETWSGRGKQPRWLSRELLAGRKLNDFLIPRIGKAPAASSRLARFFWYQRQR